MASGFWGGLTASRVLLADITFRLAERWMIFLYLFAAFAAQLVFWFVPNIVAIAVVISLLGFSIGPFFTTGISVATKLMPWQLHVAAVGFMATTGQAGSAAFPFLTGAVAAKVGMQALHPILAGLLAAMAIRRAMVPRVTRSRRTPGTYRHSVLAGIYREWGGTIEWQASSIAAVIITVPRGRFGGTCLSVAGRHPRTPGTPSRQPPRQYSVGSPIVPRLPVPTRNSPLGTFARGSGRRRSHMREARAKPMSCGREGIYLDSFLRPSHQHQKTKNQSPRYPPQQPAEILPASGVVVSRTKAERKRKRDICFV